MDVEDDLPVNAKAGGGDSVVEGRNRVNGLTIVERGFGEVA